MGYRAANTVLTRWAHLNDQPFRALIAMALMADDRHTPPPYFGGHRELAKALGMDPDHPRTPERVRRVVRGLELAGPLVAGMDGKAGQRRDYALALDPLTTYQARGVGPVEFTRTVYGAGGKPRTETYSVRLTKWVAVPRDDPRPRRDPPREMGGDPPHDVGGDPPPQRGGDLPRDVGETPHMTWDPTDRHKHSRNEGEEQAAIPLTSQRNPSTRVREPDAMNDERTPSKAEQEARLLAWAAEHCTEDPDALIA